MRVPLSWLKEYVELKLPLPQLAELLTLAGMEVEKIEQEGDWWDPETLVVGQIVAVKPHPDADRLVLVDVEYGTGTPEQVVTGAPNLFQYKGMAELPALKVAFARTGAVLLDAYSDKQPRPKKKLKPSKIRGIPSNGMVCSERELGLSEEHEGILLLPEDAVVGTPLRDELGSVVLELGLTPDMSRCLSMIGVAREVSALTNARLALPTDEEVLSSGKEAATYTQVEIADPQLCNRYVAMLIKDITIEASPQWMQERLRQAGMRPISNIVDITNYVMLEWGQPLHAFDYDLLKQRAQRSGHNEPVITVRPARSGEKLTTLDGIERELDTSMLVIADTLGCIALAGIMGGAETEVNEQTRTILLESATFDNINNRRTAQKLKLHSEASQRFTKGIPATLNAIAARRAATLMHEHAHGTVVAGMLDNYPVPQEVCDVYTTASDVERTLGMDVNLETITDCLQRLDITVERCYALPAEREKLGKSVFGLHINQGEVLLHCVAPWHRLDIQIPADLNEEVARVLGYGTIRTTMMDDALPPPHVNLVYNTEEQTRDILVGCGLQETINYTLSTPENHDKIARQEPGATEREQPFITLLNPLSIKRRVMRRSLLVSALENLAYNYRYTQRLAVFEVGRIYLPEQGQDQHPHEERRLNILLTGSRRPQSLYPDPAGSESFDFFDLKGITETLFARLGIDREAIVYNAASEQAAFTNTCAAITLEGKELGIMGEIHPQLLAAFDIPTTARVYVADLAIMPLVKPSWRLQPMRPISNYPPIVEDLAFVVDEQVSAAQLQEVIRKTAGALLTAIDLFDLYRGEPIPVGKKSLAYQLTYESLEGNLSDVRIQDIRKRIIRRVGDVLGGTLRE